jgi:uncharacterized phage protein (TIGR02218 family)
VVEARAAQAGIYGLLGEVPEVRGSQGGIYALITTGVPVRTSQAGLYALTSITADVRASQAGIYMLAAGSPCTSKWCQIWIITRADGEEFLFTSLDRDFDFLGRTYQSCDSLVPSASEAVSSVDQAGNMDLSGAIGPDGITEEALYAGLYDGALVEAWLVPWSDSGRMIRLLRGTFGPVEQTETGFKVEILGDGAKLMQTPLIRLLQPDCRWSFGDDHCQKDLSGLTVTGTVDSGIGQREFVDAARVEAAGYFRRGRVTFTTGLNAGISAEIKEHETGGVFTVWPRFQFRIAAGDQYTMEPGCTQLKETSGGTNGCTDWDNLRRYGGFRNVPGQDRRNGAANVKPPS